MAIHVRVYLPPNDITMGTIEFTPEGPKLFEDEKHQQICAGPSVEFEILDPTVQSEIPLKPDTRISFTPKSIVRNYASSSWTIQDMYPPSSKGWVTHLSESGAKALFTIQEIIGKNEYLLSIVDIQSKRLEGLFLLHNYEADILFMKTDWQRYNQMMNEISTEFEEISLEQLLDLPAPSWSDLAQLLEDINVPNLSRGKTMYDTFDQLVPYSFPENVRLELIAFLSYIIRKKIPSEDPLDFQLAMRKRFQSAPLLRLLVYGHVQCLLEGVKPPNYIRIMTMADRGLLKTGLEPTPTDRDPWGLTWYNLMESFPNRTAIVAEQARVLNQTQEIITKLPISRDEAKRSKRARIDRFSIVRNTLTMRGHIQDHRMGLLKLVYIGGAYRWPHKHLAWSARLGTLESKPPFIQVMVVPPKAAEQITRLRSKIAKIDWSASKVNYNLYNERNLRWKANTSHFMKSLSKTRTNSQLEREFKVKRRGKIVYPTHDEAKVLDLISWGIYLSSLELGNYEKMFDVDNESLRETLLKFKSQEILQLQYMSYVSGLISFCLEIKGEVDQINSVVRSALLHLPTTTAMISSTSKIGYVLGRIPEEISYEMVTQLPIIAKDYGMEIRLFRMAAYVGYVHNLYQRLLRSDKTWDDDISSFLSQIRS